MNGTKLMLLGISLMLLGLSIPNMNNVFGLCGILGFLLVLAGLFWSDRR